MAASVVLSAIAEIVSSPSSDHVLSFDPPPPTRVRPLVGFGHLLGFDHPVGFDHLLEFDHLLVFNHPVGFDHHLVFDHPVRFDHLFEFDHLLGFDCLVGSTTSSDPTTYLFDHLAKVQREREREGFEEL